MGPRTGSEAPGEALAMEVPAKAKKRKRNVPTNSPKNWDGVS